MPPETTGELTIAYTSTGACSAPQTLFPLAGFKGYRAPKKRRDNGNVGKKG